MFFGQAFPPSMTEPAPVSVRRYALDRLKELARKVPCTNARCKHASPAYRTLVCEACLVREAVDNLEFSHG